MAKVKTIQEKREEMEKALKRLEAFEKIIDKIEEGVRWDCCSIKHDDNGDIVYDEGGEYIFEPPEKGEYRYDDYIAMTAALDEIKALV